MDSETADYRSVQLIVPATLLSPENSGYSYAPIFLHHAKEIMGEEAFYGFLSEVYQTYTNKVVHSEEILTILRSYNDSKEMNDLITFYFKEN